MSVTITSQTAFSIHAAAYWAARSAYEKHQTECQAVLESGDPLQLDYDKAYTPLVTAMNETAVNAALVPAATTAEIHGKVRIILNEHLHELQRETVLELFEALGRDAARIGGVS